MTTPTTLDRRADLPTPRTDFRLAASSSATEPPEARGVDRDGVRLLVARPGDVRHVTFADLPAQLDPGDVVVVNTSATLPAAIDVRRGDGRDAVLHLSTARPDGTWLVEVRPDDEATGQAIDVRAGERLRLPGGREARLLDPHGGRPDAPRLWRASFDTTDVTALLARYGRPIRYAYVPEPWPLADYQTVFAREPGSAEMPSASRPFTDRLVTDLVVRGVLVVPVRLHTGVSSLAEGEGPLTEPYAVPPTTARVLNEAVAAGGRVVAAGTTVARALETVTDPTGRVHAGSGWTDLVLGPERPPRVVDGLITGWHAPGASHLLLLEAVAGPRLVRAAYEAAVAEGYLWHEFGDSCLLLP